MKAKYDTIGQHYNQTRKADPYLTERLFQNLEPKKVGFYLDIGCGTGNYTNALQKRGFDFIGIDPSERMLEKAKLINSAIDWRLGTAEQTGLEDSSIDGIIGSLTIHHWTDLNISFQELYRVLKTKGNIVIFTASPDQMKGYWLNHYFPKMLQDSINQMPGVEKVKAAMTSAGFKIRKKEKYSIQPDLIDQFLYCGKQQPELYLNPNIRNGISSFSALANKEEVEKGLLQLEGDIASGKIDDVIQSYENDMGDYLYIVGQK
ncbi:MAG: SAM-dependent methyltransferase [Saprospiraceae bacterium]|jgi:SAM-dependent methyltransferase